MRALLHCFSLLLAALIVASCATHPVDRRIKRFPERYAPLSSTEKDLVLRGEVKEGMSPDAVFLAWGPPSRIMSSSRDGRGRERWAYFRSVPVSTFSVGVGSYYGPFYSSYGMHPAYGYGYGPGWGFGNEIDYQVAIDRSVEFSNGRVVAWEQAR